MLNDREDNVRELQREAERLDRRKATQEWARRWRDGQAHCPSCGGVDHLTSDSTAQDAYIYINWRCICGARWKVEYREFAVCISDVIVDDEWIELADLDQTTVTPTGEGAR
jgi:hypothetical protein